MSETRTFHIGDVLSITTGRLVSPTHIDGVYNILNWMTGDNLMTHQLPRACRECQVPLKVQFPELDEIAIPSFGNTKDEAESKLRAWLVGIVAKYGETRDVAPLAPGDHTIIDPIAELRMVAPDAQVIVVRETES